ncbi:MAG TPA: serine protease [Gemmatimonadaceae bacterium]|nr:serine protease [Gemmatimonadaceae bacterium]
MTMSTAPLDTADVFRSAATSLADSLARAVVQVRTRDTGSAGTGLIWEGGATALVVTNAHCVPRGATIEVSSDGRWREARVIAYHPPHDLALLASPSLSGGGPSLELRDAESLRPGELLFAHGHPLGVRDALAMGVLHDVARDRRTGAPRWIVADVRLAPGNSGGPLVDAEGRLVGINSMVVNGLGVAVPAALVQQFIDRVLARRAA